MTFQSKQNNFDCVNDNAIVNWVAWKLDHILCNPQTLEQYLSVFLSKQNSIDKIIIFLRIHRMSTTCLQGIHDRNITRNIQGKTC